MPSPPGNAWARPPAPISSSTASTTVSISSGTARLPFTLPRQAVSLLVLEPAVHDRWFSWWKVADLVAVRFQRFDRKCMPWFRAWKSCRTRPRQRGRFLFSAR